MPRPDEWITVELTPERYQRAQRRAKAQLRRYPEDNGEFPDYGGVPREVRLERWQVGREAVAQLRGLDVDKLPKDIIVKWVPQQPAEAVLKIPLDAIRGQSGSRWILVTGRGAKVCIVGGARPRKAPEMGLLRDDVLRPAYYIPSSRLVPIARRGASA